MEAGTRALFTQRDLFVMKLEVNDTSACGVAAQFVVVIVVSVQNDCGMQEMSEAVSGWERKTQPFSA